MEAVDEVKAILLESVNTWKNFEKRMTSRNSTGVTLPRRNTQGKSNVYSQVSGLEDVVFNDFIKDDFIQEGDGQVASGSASQISLLKLLNTIVRKPLPSFFHDVGKYWLS